jgi:hypothetical protein
MATVEDLDGVIERCQQAMREFGKGNPEHMKALYSHREDVTINTAIDPPADRTRSPWRWSAPRLDSGKARSTPSRP